jgi:hypothetical protein
LQVTNDRKEMTTLRKQVAKLDAAEAEAVRQLAAASARVVALEAEAKLQLEAMARVRDQLAKVPHALSSSYLGPYISPYLAPI